MVDHGKMVDWNFQAKAADTLHGFLSLVCRRLPGDPHAERSPDGGDAVSPLGFSFRHCLVILYHITG